MRIVLYNFIQPGDPTSKQGGGVAIYQGNLIRALQDRGDEVICLSSGDRYSFLAPQPRLMRKRVDGVERAIVLNSPVFAPAHFAFHKLDAYSRSPGLDQIPASFKARYGEIDVFHFQNVEGLTAGFFKALRQAYPKTRIVVSAHNYNLVCPQVNLWFREHAHCTDYREGRSCVNCLMSGDRSAFETNQRRIDLAKVALKARGGSLKARAVEWGIRAVISAKRRLLRQARSPAAEASMNLMSPDRAEIYAEYRKTNIALVQTVFDQVLAVSKRTRDVLVERGVAADKVKVSYIGTSQHRHYLTARKRMAAKDGLHIAFLGYMRADKGFYFFIESLFSISETLARKMDVTIAAPIWESYPIDRLKGLAHRFRSITIHDGYTHDRLDAMLATVDLGVVPVLWEDNLPQVAIEMVTRGVPLLCSSRGGAQEIADDPRFVFQAGSTRAFCAKLEEIASGRLRLSEFWRRPPRIFSMQEHVQDLLECYGAAPRPQSHEVRVSAGTKKKASLTPVGVEA